MAVKPKSLAPAVALSRKFFGAPPRYVRRLSVKWPGQLTYLGRAGSVSYVCDKQDGRVREWVHTFNKRGTAVLCAAPAPVGRSPYKNMLVILGNFRVTQNGIEG